MKTSGGVDGDMHGLKKAKGVLSTTGFWCSNLRNNASLGLNRLPKTTKLAKVMLLAPSSSMEKERSFLTAQNKLGHELHQG